MDHFRFSSLVTLSRVIIPEDTWMIRINSCLRLLSAVLLVITLLWAVYFSVTEVSFFISWGDFLVLSYRLLLFEWSLVWGFIVIILLVIIVVIFLAFKITVTHSILILVIQILALFWNSLLGVLIVVVRRIPFLI